MDNNKEFMNALMRNLNEENKKRVTDIAEGLAEKVRDAVVANIVSGSMADMAKETKDPALMALTSMQVVLADTMIDACIAQLKVIKEDSHVTK